ncbi:hypothetical protein TNCV_4597881 [Trichonephila clavipes]|nr:hypothetical protein TNCV_4597881 [Trichonephila clavipes]
MDTYGNYWRNLQKLRSVTVDQRLVITSAVQLDQPVFVALRHELRNPHDPGNYSNDWLDQSAASYMLAGYSPQSFLLYFSDMGWRLASRAICPDIVTVTLGKRSRSFA